MRTHDRWDPLNLLAQSGPVTIREMMTELASSTFPGHDTWLARLLNYVDEHRHRSSPISRGLFECLACRARTMRLTSSTSCPIAWSTWTLAVDTWEIPLDETFAERDFPGVEVDRSEAWGVVGHVAGRGNGPSLRLNAHVDVVPPGDLLAWEGADPFSGRVTGNK